MKKIILIIFFVGIWNYQLVAHAQMMPKGGMRSGGSICDRLLNEDEKEMDPEERKAQAQQRAQQKRQQQDQQIAQKRIQNEEKRDVSYEKIYSIVDTDEKKVAIDVFKEEVDAAIMEFQKFQDEILIEFRTRTDEIFSNVEIETKSDLSKIQSIEMQVFMNDLKTYCEEKTYTEREIEQMMREKMMETGQQETNRPGGRIGQVIGGFNLANNQDLLELKNEKNQQLALARNQMHESIKVAGEKLKASL